MTKVPTSITARATIVAMLGAVAFLLPQAVRGSEVTLPPVADRLEAGVLGPTELAGFTSLQCPILRTDAAAWAGPDTTTRLRLQANGFVMGLREILHANGEDASVTSSAEHFRTRAGAAAEMAEEAAAARRPGSVEVAAGPRIHGLRLSTGRDAVIPAGSSC